MWCSLQAQVEKEHFLKRTDVQALVKSGDNTWENSTTPQDVIGRVWRQLRNVLVLIEEDNGGNNLVETKRGKKNYDLHLPTDDLIESTRDKTNKNNSNINDTSLNNVAVINVDKDMDDDEEDMVESKGVCNACH